MPKGIPQDIPQGSCRIGEGDCSKTGKLSAGWCPKHYQRLRRSGGDPLATKRIKFDDEARFWSKVDRRGDDECWPWTGDVGRYGYGIFSVGYGGDRKLVKAHVWAYQRFVGPIPEEAPVLDHACHTRDLPCRDGDSCLHRRCVNFLQFGGDAGRMHLEAVTRAENNRRAHRSDIPADLITALYQRRVAGEPVAFLAAEVGMKPATLNMRWARMVRRGDLEPAVKPRAYSRSRSSAS